MAVFFGQNVSRNCYQASDAEAAGSDIHFLEQEVDRLKLISEALWGLLKEKLNVEDQDLMARIAQLDLADGKADGKLEKGPQLCSACGRTNSRRHDYCIYCGHLFEPKPFG